MPMSSAQLAALVDRARQKPLPVVSPAAGAGRPAPCAAAEDGAITTTGDSAAATASSAPCPGRACAVSSRTRTAVLRSGTQAARPKATVAAPLPPPTAVPSVPASQPEQPGEDFPIGWELNKDSWRFHRVFYRIFKRPMRPGEYSHLLKQIRRREAEHLGDNAWRVTLPDGRTTLPVRASKWTLLTILPKDWQPRDRQLVPPTAD